MYSKYYYTPEQLKDRLQGRANFPKRGFVMEKEYKGEWILYYRLYFKKDAPGVVWVIGYKRCREKYVDSDGRTVSKFEPIPQYSRVEVNSLLGGHCQFHEKEG